MIGKKKWKTYYASIIGAVSTQKALEDWTVLMQKSLDNGWELQGTPVAIAGGLFQALVKYVEEEVVPS